MPDGSGISAASRRRVGVLVCDHVPDEFRGVAGDYPDMLSILLASRWEGAEIVAYDVVAGEIPAGPTVCDGWVTTGSRFSVYEPQPWIAALTDFVVAVHGERVPFVGICFGHQLLAQALGGEVARSPGGWGVGAKTARVVAPEAWMEPPAPSFRILYSHQDQVVGLPEGGRVLATAGHAAVAMLAVGDHLLGIQGHPEFVPAYAEALLRRRRGGRIPASTADEALA